MFKLRCENCGYENDISEFLFDFHEFQDKYDERFTHKTMTVECHICGIHHHIEQDTRG